MKKIKYLTLLTLVCLTICLVLSIGVAYGRYQTEFARKSYIFAPELPDNIYMCGSVPGEWLDHGNLPALGEKWLPSDHGMKLDFGVTNGNAQQVSQREQTYVIRLAAGLGIENPEKLTVTLYWWDQAGEIHWQTATATPIQEGTTLHASFGDGWVYQIYQNGDEVQFSLPGGSLAYSNYTITVAGDVAPTLLDLQVIGQEA